MRFEDTGLPDHDVIREAFSFGLKAALSGLRPVEEVPEGQQREEYLKYRAFVARDFLADVSAGVRVLQQLDRAPPEILALAILREALGKMKTLASDLEDEDDLDLEPEEVAILKSDLAALEDGFQTLCRNHGSRFSALANEMRAIVVDARFEDDDAYLDAIHEASEDFRKLEVALMAADLHAGCYPAPDSKYATLPFREFELQDMADVFLAAAPTTFELEDFFIASFNANARRIGSTLWLEIDDDSGDILLTEKENILAPEKPPQNPPQNPPAKPKGPKR